MAEEKVKSGLKDYIKTGFFFLIAGILVLYIAVSVFMPENTVKVFGFKPYVITTPSMEPVINVNDLIIVKKPKVNELEEEDIISFYQDTDFDGEDDVVTHYIYDINTNSDGDLVFLTHRYFEEGTPVFIDNWVIGEDDVIGQHAFTIPYVGAVVQFVKSPFGIAAMVVNLGIIVGIIYIMKKSNK